MLMEFLSFERFISLELLIGFYYLGALVIPIFIWRWTLSLTKRLQLDQLANDSLLSLWRVLPPKQRGYLLLFLALSFLFAQIFWRMMFEFLIAYLQIRAALLQGCSS